jgi:hypothetical protein
MLPDGGARVINHTLEASTGADDDDDGMGKVVVAREDTPFSDAGAAAGAGASSSALDRSEFWGKGAGAARAYEAALEAGLIRGATGAY